MGQTALHLCAGAGHKTCLAQLLDHGGDLMINERDTAGNTALHCAAKEGQLACVRLLLETAADGNARNTAGQTPYNVASSRGHQQISLLLLEYIEPQSARIAPRPTTGYVNVGTLRDFRPSTVDSSVVQTQGRGRRGDVDSRSSDSESLPRPHTSSSPLRRGQMAQSPSSPYHVVSRSSDRDNNYVNDGYNKRGWRNSYNDSNAYTGDDK